MPGWMTTHRLPDGANEAIQSSDSASNCKGNIADAECMVLALLVEQFQNNLFYRPQVYMNSDGGRMAALTSSLSSVTLVVTKYARCDCNAIRQAFTKSF